jgi:hypothetical protein
LGLRLEYTACVKRIKGESKDFSGKVPENELTERIYRHNRIARRKRIISRLGCPFSADLAVNFLTD